MSTRDNMFCVHKILSASDTFVHDYTVDIEANEHQLVIQHNRRLGLERYHQLNELLNAIKETYQTLIELSKLY